MAEWIKAQDPTVCYLQGIHSTGEGINRLKGWKWYSKQAEFKSKQT
jgi:hypothetical protein